VNTTLKAYQQSVQTIICFPKELLKIFKVNFVGKLSDHINFYFSV